MNERTRFVLRYGVLNWGLPVSVLSAVVSELYFFEGHGMLEMVVALAIYVPLGVLAGVWFGLQLWNRGHRRD